VYRSLVRRKAQATYRALSRGDYETVVRGFASDAILKFPGDHAFAGTFEGRAAIRGWFKRLHETFPDFRLEPEAILVNGFPWDTVVATRFTVTATLPNGNPYVNTGMQFLRLRWGRIVEDVLYEDTQHLAAVLSEHAATGRPEAAAGPSTST
jgi:ketosteroid isomerase-like protein